MSDQSNIRRSEASTNGKHVVPGSADSKADAKASPSTSTSRTTTVSDRQSTTKAPENGASDAPVVPPQVIRETNIQKKKRKVSPALIAAALVLLGVVVWYFFFRADPKPAVTVRYAVAETGDIQKSVTATGTVQATTTVQVGSQVSGTIRELYADFNTRVTKGQLLAVLDPTAYEASLTEAKAGLEKAQADLTMAERDEVRQRDLLARQLIAAADYDVSKNKLANARAAVVQQQSQVKKAEVNVSYTVIRSPISGVVVSRNVDKGQTVAASLNAPVLFNIAQDLSSMQVAASVDEADIGQVVDGQQVKFTVSAYPGEAFTGTVQQIRINPVTTQNVVTYTVIILTGNPNGKLLPGMTATVNIVSASRNGVLKVPSAALRFVPPAELLGAAAAKDSAAIRARIAARRQRAPGDTTRRGMNDRPIERTIYIKARTATANGSPIQPIRVVPGLSDGSYTEVLSSYPQLQPGDSVVIGAFSASATTSSPSGGSTPLGGMRGMGGGGGGRGGGGR